MRRRTVILLAILSGILISLVASYGLIRHKARNRGVVVNEWRVSFRTGDFGNNYLLRSAIALASLGNAIPEEAMFFHGYFDEDGLELQGAEKYILTFEAQPPVDAFWSVTVYDADSGFLTYNDIGRYTLGDRSESMVFSEDGNLSIYFQHDAPSDELMSNWMPIPKGDFSVTLRCYLPQKELLFLDWNPPGIVRQDSSQGGEK